jgi:hypothetical protein
MKLKQAARRIWRNVEAAAHASDFDPLAEMQLRVERLEHEGQSQAIRLAALAEQVQALSEQTHGPAGRRG